MSDHDLLQRYACEGSETAFKALVERHLNLVYSVARRVVRSPQLAEDVAQAVFADLARHAQRLDPATPLVAWLHLVSRRTAIDTVRRETRRRAREQAAAQLSELVESAAMKPDTADWDDVEPLLDDAVESLPAADRTAILLRYFENKSLRDVGAVLGTSDDAAQKRVTRALAQLRMFFLRRGIAVTAAGLATNLSAHAVEAAPAMLGASIASAATLTGAASTAAVETSRVIAMTTLQKSAAVIAFAAVGGFGLYETSLAARQAEQVRGLRDQVDRTAAKIRDLRDEREHASAQLATVEKQIDARIASGLPLSAADAALEAQMKEWLSRRDKYRDALARYPQLNIPELALLSDEEWNNIAGGQPLDTEQEVRQVTAKLRQRAEGHAAARISGALRSYLKAHPDTLPATPQELAPYFDPPIDAAILDRWEVVQTGKLSEVPRNEQSKILAVKHPADLELDTLYSAGANGYGNTPAVGANISAAHRAFSRAHPGQRATTAAELKPYLRWPLSDEVLAKFMSNRPPTRP